MQWEPGNPPNIRRLDSVENQLSNTARLVTALNLSYNGPRKEVERLENDIIESTEYILETFAGHDPTIRCPRFNFQL